MVFVVVAKYISFRTFRAALTVLGSEVQCDHNSETEEIGSMEWMFGGNAAVNSAEVGNVDASPQDVLIKPPSN